VPLWVRIQASNSFNKMVSKNIRSVSAKWAIDKMLTRGFPSAVYSKFLIDKVRAGIKCPVQELPVSVPDFNFFLLQSFTGFGTTIAHTF
jgi:hypothetical protein